MTVIDSPLILQNKPLPPALIYLLLFVVAFVPRTLALDAYVAPDEGKWIYRSAHFLQALLAGDLAQTTSVAATPEVEVLAPAVPTMWTGALGLVAKYWLDGGHGGAGSLSDYLAAIPDRTEKIPLPFYPWTRWPTVLLTSLAIPFCYFLFSKLMGPGAALLAMLLLALDPFFMGLSRVIHHDALVSIFITVSLLTLLLYRRRRSRRWLALSAIAGGLALLTKPTALYLVVFTGLFLLLELGLPRRRADWRRATLDGLIWGAVALVTFVVVWPALWVAPFETITALLQRSTSALADENNYSLIPAPGAPLPELGFLYYPVNWLFKATLPLMIGLVALAADWRRGWFTEIGQAEALDQDRADRPAVSSASVRFTITWLTGFILLFWLLLIPADTRDIRYFLPAVPALYALAAIGILALTSRLTPGSTPALQSTNTQTPEASPASPLAPRSPLPAPRSSLPASPPPPLPASSPPRLLASALRPLPASLQTWTLALLLACQLILVPVYFPYFVDYWNPVVGGPWLAPRLVKIGSGEGLDRMGRYLSQKPGAGELTVANSFWESFAPFFAGHYTKAHYDEEADYILIYRRQIQNRNPFPEYWTYFSARPPEYKVSLVGLDYAWLYPGPQLRVVREAEFGHGLTLRGYRLERWAAEPGQTAELTLVWGGATATQADQKVIVRLTGTDGRLWVEAGGPLLAPAGPSPVEGHYPLALPPQIERGDYDLWVSVGPAGTNAGAELGLQAGRIAVRRLKKPLVQWATSINFGDLMTFGGADISPPGLSASGEAVIPLKLLWQARQAMARSYTTFVHVVDEAGQIWGQADRIPSAGDQPLPTPEWDQDEWIIDTFQLTLKPDTPPGNYTLRVGVYDSERLERLPVIGEAEGQTVVELTSIRVP